MITLGVDVGTTHTKVLALEVSSGGVLALETGPTPVARDADGEAHRPAEVLELVLTLASDVVGRLDDPVPMSRFVLEHEQHLEIQRAQWEEGINPV